MWPSFFPGRCPPADAKDSQGIVYRGITGNTPVEQDFLSYEELNKPLGDPCERCGLSVYRSLAEFEHVLNRISPKLRKKIGCQHIARVTLDPALGKLKATPSNSSNGHHTLWIYDNMRSALVQSATFCK